jgi:hypothetical protein
VYLCADLVIDAACIDLSTTRAALASSASSTLQESKHGVGHVAYKKEHVTAAESSRGARHSTNDKWQMLGHAAEDSAAGIGGG